MHRTPANAGSTDVYATPTSATAVPALGHRLVDGKGEPNGRSEENR